MQPEKTRALRVEANNAWPRAVTFPAEALFVELLAAKNVVQPFLPCRLSEVDDPEFHIILAAILDGLDLLPGRPDRAFGSFWVSADAEMIRLKEAAAPIASSRFLVHMDRLGAMAGIAGVIDAMLAFTELVPLQLCEYVARRIVEADEKRDGHAISYLNRIKEALGVGFEQAFIGKYAAVMRHADVATRAGAQRKAGSLLKRLFRGEALVVDGYTVRNEGLRRLAFLLSTALPSMRNERFHGIVFLSYRSSAATLKHYASDYFACAMAYYVLLLSVVDRFPSTVNVAEFEGTVRANADRFRDVFGKQIGQ